MIIIKFITAINRLSNKREKNKHEPKTKKFVDNNKIWADMQVSHRGKDLNI